MDAFLKHVKELEEKKKVPMDYWNVLEEEARPSGYLHIDFQCCQRLSKGCEHRFTDKTQEEYKKLLFSFVVSSL